MTELAKSIITPDWPAPANVKAIQTTRVGGISAAPYDSLNFGDHVQDNPQHVARNRQSLNTLVPSEPVWLNQVHSTLAIDAANSLCVMRADASYSHEKNVVCTVMTADCLPVLVCNQQGTAVAAIHAGWRGLCDGIIESTIKAMEVDVAELMVWLGPAIGPEAFEVGDEVRAQFAEKDPKATLAFKQNKDKWLGDLYMIAKQRLNNLGVHAVYGKPLCTYSNAEKFFSYRRDGDTGRMATLIWITI